ncbi:hypothetical protein BDW72DRAFT_170550 [Aspergillus terricola var. indicus]
MQYYLSYTGFRLAQITSREACHLQRTTHRTYRTQFHRRRSLKLTSSDVARVLDYLQPAGLSMRPLKPYGLLGVPVPSSRLLSTVWGRGSYM